MAHLYKTVDWQGASGKWYCNDVSDLAGVSGKWWVPARMLGLSLPDYILMLKEKFNATIVKYNPETNYLHFYWEKYSDCHKYVLYINKESRNRKFMV